MASSRTRASRRPRRLGVWIMTAVLVAMVLTVLTVSGLVNSTIGNDARARAPESAGSVPPAVSAGGPIIDARTDPVRSSRLPDRTVALTFDDGPDPTWTPEVLAVLRRHQVPGTFFVVGSMVARFPEVAREITTSGSEIGVHTFTHPDLAGVSSYRFDREVADTQLAIEGSTGATTHLLRPPFSSTADALDDPGYRTVTTAGGDGYVTVLTDVDGEDWQRPGVEAIVRNATPQNGAGATVLLHDAGGDRSQTVAALDRLIPELQAQGYRFTTVSDAAGLGPVNTSAPARDRWVGSALLGTVGLAEGVVRGLQFALIAVGVLVVGRLVIMVWIARRHARRRRDPSFTWGEPVTEPVTVVVPAYNESENIEATVRSILANDHPLEVLVVDDGSTDGTADLIEGLALPRVRVIRQPNSGKSTALNRGVAAARHDLVVMIDGDTIFQADTVGRLVAPFADPGVGAVAGNVKIANRDRLIPRLQHIEYVVGFNVDRRVQDEWGSISTIPGAAGAFRRRAVQEVGGLSSDTLAEDTDLTIALGRAGWRVVYEDRALAWTEAPLTMSQLWRQRYRWSYGTIQAIWKHRRALREQGASGRMGRLGLAHIATFHIALPLAAPLVDLFFVYGLLFGDPAVALLLWGSMLALQSLAAAYAFSLDGEPRGPLWALPVQQLMYRQLMYVVLVQSVVSAVSGVGVRWQKLHRVGAMAAQLGDGRSRPAGEDAAPAPRGPAPDAPVASRPAPVAPEGATGTGGAAGAAGAAGAVAASSATPRSGGRERWLDLLRAVALVRVVTYHAFGWGWMSMVFPSMGIMFALGGSLMVQSLRRGVAVDVIGHRLRRLLPPLWLFGLLAVPVMIWFGWTAENADEGGSPLAWQQLLYWVVPVLDPPGSAWGADAVVGLWYIRAYLWFVLLTPLLLWAFRRRPVLAVSVPLAIVALDAVTGSTLTDWGDLGPALLDACTFGACWMLGFAHRDGTLARMKGWLAGLLAVVGVGAGLAWAFSHPAGVDGVDLNDIPLAQALVSVGAVLVFLRVSPRVAWLERVPVLGRLVTVINARAITIYLWHNVAIAAAAPLADRYGWTSDVRHFGLALVLTVVAVFAFGWVEDVAAGRRISLLPDGRGRARVRPERAAGPTPPRIPDDVESGVTYALPQSALATRLAALPGRLLGGAGPRGGPSGTTVLGGPPSGGRPGPHRGPVPERGAARRRGPAPDRGSVPDRRPTPTPARPVPAAHTPARPVPATHPPARPVPAAPAAPVRTPTPAPRSAPPISGPNPTVSAVPALSGTGTWHGASGPIGGGAPAAVSPPPSRRTTDDDLAATAVPSRHGVDRRDVMMTFSPGSDPTPRREEPDPDPSGRHRRARPEEDAATPRVSRHARRSDDSRH